MRQILADHNQDYDIAPKHGAILQENGFQVLESKKKTVVYGKRTTHTNTHTMETNPFVRRV